jgi:hypothetical protein
MRSDATQLRKKRAALRAAGAARRRPARPAPPERIAGPAGAHLHGPDSRRAEAGLQAAPRSGRPRGVEGRAGPAAKAGSCVIAAPPYGRCADYARAASADSPITAAVSGRPPNPDNGGFTDATDEPRRPQAAPPVPPRTAGAGSRRGVLAADHDDPDRAIAGEPRPAAGGGGSVRVPVVRVVGVVRERVGVGRARVSLAGCRRGVAGCGVGSAWEGSGV